VRLIEQRVGFNEALVYFSDSMIQFISLRPKNSPDELGTIVHYRTPGSGQIALYKHTCDISLELVSASCSPSVRCRGSG
jgi:hypothetical protein